MASCSLLSLFLALLALLALRNKEKCWQCFVITMYLLYILKKVTLVQNISWIDTDCEFGIFPHPQSSKKNKHSLSICCHSQLNQFNRFRWLLKCPGFLYQRKQNTYEWVFRSRWLHTHTPWPWHMVLVQSWEKGDEPLPAGFKGWQLGLSLGFAAPACSQPLLLLVALSTPHGSHLSLSLFSLKKKKRATGCRPLWPVPFWILSTPKG